MIHVDIDPAELNKVRRADVAIAGDCRCIEDRSALDRGACDGAAGATPGTSRRGWWPTHPRRLAGARPRSHYDARPATSSDGPLKPQFVIEALRDHSARRTPSSPRASASTRCGPRSAGSSTSPTPGSTPAGSGTMGFAVPAAIGAKVGGPTRTVWAIDGDGCFQMTAQELVTASVRADPGQDRDPQQRLPGHGPPVAGDVLRGALLRGLPLAGPARLRELGRGDGLRGHPGRVARATSRRRSTRPTPSTTARS